jgi:opacity protein-like surface antigen
MTDRGLCHPQFQACLGETQVARPVIAPVATWTGLYLGVHGGAAWQSAPNWSAVDPNGVTAPATLTGSTNLGAVGGSSLQMSANTQWLASARGKFGYAAWNNTLLYVTGGAAWANIESDRDFDACCALATADIDIPSACS